MKEQKLIYWGLYEYNKELYVAISGKQDDFFNDPNAIFAKVYDITKSYVVVKNISKEIIWVEDEDSVFIEAKSISKEEFQKFKLIKHKLSPGTIEHGKYVYFDKKKVKDIILQKFLSARTIYQIYKAMYDWGWFIYHNVDVFKK